VREKSESGWTVASDTSQHRGIPSGEQARARERIDTDDSVVQVFKVTPFKVLAEAPWQ
jgi:hypothetical protein